MTAPVSLREYFATVSSGYTKADADVIGPQLEALAEEGDVTERDIVDTSKSDNSPLHRYFVWDDAVAGDKYRLHQASTMMKSIRVRVIEDNRAKVTPAYRITREQPKAQIGRGHNVLRGDSAAAVAKAKEAYDELVSWRARYSPYAMVWADFALAFRGVVNQVGEAEDVVNTAALDDRTDEALTDLLQVIASAEAWRAKHGGVADAWSAVAEQAGFIVEAIDEATKIFTKDLKVAERNCLGCGKPFQSGGAGNRMCERCTAR